MLGVGEAGGWWHYVKGVQVNAAESNGKAPRPCQADTQRARTINQCGLYLFLIGGVLDLGCRVPSRLVG
eukprot:6560645-Ditylum_brightwellii.AAC.1